MKRVSNSTWNLKQIIEYWWSRVNCHELIDENENRENVCDREKEENAKREGKRNEEKNKNAIEGKKKDPSIWIKWIMLEVSE